MPARGQRLVREQCSIAVLAHLAVFASRKGGPLTARRARDGEAGGGERWRLGAQGGDRLGSCIKSGSTRRSHSGTLLPTGHLFGHLMTSRAKDRLDALSVARDRAAGAHKLLHQGGSFAMVLHQIQNKP
jgi:hypothetical protein